MSIISPTTIEALAKRKAGIEPNYYLEHVCPECKLRSLCPDRYLNPSCSPTDFCKEKGWGDYSYTCLPCMLKLSPEDEDRAIWYEAHGVDESQPKEQAA